jgi:lambda family phage portal protein
MPFEIFGYSLGKTQKAKNQELTDNYIKASLSFYDFASGYNGDKTGFFSGFGLTKDMRCVNLKTLQYRSLQLSRENPFVAAILGRLVTKIINSGLVLRANPYETILSKYVKDGFLDDWSDNVECLYDVWSKDKRLVTNRGKHTLQNLERIVFRTAMISGDCLVIKSSHPKLGTPVLDIVDGINIMSPMIFNPAEKNIVNGVEIDAAGKEIAYYYESETGEIKEIKAYDNKGKRRAWLVTITENRIDERRGLPLLAVILQNLNELGKYLDSEQRAALVNSYVAVVHTKSASSPNKTNPFKNSGDNVENPDPNSTMKYKQMQPGFMATNLAAGEEVKSFDTSRPNVNFAKFSEFITKINSYSLGIPPECLFLEFNSNYSASRQAKLELEDLIKEKLSIFTAVFSQPIYEDFLDTMILSGMVKAPKYIESINNVYNFHILGAWRASTWRGLTKSNVDGLKQAKELVILRDNCWMTDDQIADEYCGTDFQANIRAQKKSSTMRKEIQDILEPPVIDDTQDRLDELEQKQEENKQ